MDNLVMWLRAQVDDDERVARSATAANDGEAAWEIEPPDPQKPYGRSRLLWLDVTDSSAPETMPPDMAEHIACWDPVRALAEVDAKRCIVADFEKALATRREHPDDLATVGALLALLGVLKTIAATYADRPGYNPDGWKFG